MKLALVFTAMILISSSAFGGGEGGSAGGNGSSPKKSRSIASVEDEESEFRQSTDNYAKDCLHKLHSNFKVDIEDKDYRAKIDNEIKNSLNEKMKNPSEQVNSVQYPDCYAYAMDTENESIKALLGSRSNGISARPTENASNASAK